LTILKLQIIGGILLPFLLCLPTTYSQQINPALPSSSMMADGKILFSPMWGHETYLINSTGIVDHEWTSDYLPGIAVCWLGGGEIMRAIKVGPGPNVGGLGGGVQIQQADGTILWDYRYNSNGHFSHHDLKVLPNGDVLLIAWEMKTQAEAVAAGRNPDYVSAWGMMPDHIIEVKPTGPTSGEIVWEWHVWDHLIQDYDASKQNYGVVGDHPELVDVNYVTSLWQGDWMHTNTVDYNRALDQILLSVPNFNEIWIIDHGTTTEEAAGHTGGRYGHGGDLLYRWGNPVAYRTGTSDDQKLFYQHGVSWIEEGLPGEGDILIFNNGDDRPGGQYSSVDEITPPINENGTYDLEPGSAYEPSTQTWVYTATPPASFYAGHLSGAQRLANGDTLICNGETGQFFEVTTNGVTVWEYMNPFPYPSMNELFKVVYIPKNYEPNQPDLDCSGQLTWTGVKPGQTVTGSFTVQNIGDAGSLLNWTINASLMTWGTWTFMPQTGKNLTPEEGSITAQVSVVAPKENHGTFQGYLRVENINDSSDFDIIPVSLTTRLAIGQGLHEWTPLALLQWLLAKFLPHIFYHWFSIVN
jgi:hypothetical protein